ncbi:MAG TPA: DUF4834 family protein [Niastella sp.]
MSISRILLWILLAFFIYKFVFGFLAPLLKMTWRMRRQIKEFQRQQQQDPLQNNTASSQPSSTNNDTAPKSKTGEYIDFEEVKEK